MMKRSLLSGLLAALVSTNALASNWGCEVLLCLSNPKGPEAVSQCVPPIQKLWVWLHEGRPFPGCTGAGAGNYAGNTWANGGYCTASLISINDYSTADESSNPVPVCNAQGSINVTVNGKLTSRVWWGIQGQPNDTLFESASAGQLNYNPTTVGAQALATWENSQNMGCTALGNC